MPYEYLFLGMVGVVASAMAAGVAAGRLQAMPASVAVCAGYAACMGAAAYVLARQQDGGFAVLLGAAATLFGWVIALCAALMTRRVLGRRSRAADVA